ncbi:MAG: nitrilase family protein [Acetobacteraceae bacterium]|nr:nitrilase family protein [Acetobacteraceae bacterium]
MAQQREVCIACIQMEPVIGAKDANIAKSLALVGAAADRGAQLAVLPELCDSGYVFETKEEAFALAEEVTRGKAVRAWQDIAAERSLFVVAGVNERDGDTIYNTAVVIGPAGLAGIFRKVHLWDRENLFFSPGNLGFPVFDTPFGRLATFICYDGWFSESYRCCRLQEADIICIPTNWVPMPGQPDNTLAMANILVMAGAHANSVIVAAADRVGTERGQPFLGQSLIVNHMGWPVAGPASRDAEEILLATLDLAGARAGRQLNEHNDLLQNRRPGMYGAMLRPGMSV